MEVSSPTAVSRRRAGSTLSWNDGPYHRMFGSQTVERRETIWQPLRRHYVSANTPHFARMSGLCLDAATAVPTSDERPGSDQRHERKPVKPFRTSTGRAGLGRTMQVLVVSAMAAGTLSTLTAPAHAATGQIHGV